MDFDLDKEISSKMYPLTHRWLRVEILKKLLGAFAVVGVVAFDNYFGTPGFFIRFLFTIDVVVFAFLGFIAVVSAIAFWGILQSLRMFLYSEYVVTEKGVEYRTSHKQGVVKLLPYENIKETSIKRGVFGRIFGYASLWLNPPPWRRRLYFIHEDGSSFTFRGLSKNEAEYIEKFIRQRSLVVVSK